MKDQANSLVAMQTQLANIQQFCMAVGQQPPSSIYILAQQQHTFNNHNKCNGGSQNSGRGVPQQPTMSFGNPGAGQQQALCPPTPYKLELLSHVTPMAVILTTLTPVQGVANQDLRTTLMQAAPTSWVDRLSECTRQSCPQRAAALRDKCSSR